jgi:hypothetical protein
MNTKELKNALNNAGISPDIYALTGGLPNEVYCLNHFDAYWEVYYSERGAKSGLMRFDTEDEACIYLYNLLVKYQS